MTHLFPKDVSADGYRIDHLIVVTLVFVTLLFLVMVAWMVASYLRGRKRPVAWAAPGPRDKILPLALASCVLVVVDGNLFFHSTSDVEEIYWNFKAAEADPNVVRIEINAHQWAWDARYAGPDGQFGTSDDVVTLNDIRVPKGAPVVFQLAAVDVIHSFYLPNFRVKMDALPGAVHKLWIRAQETGQFEIACAQHCGVNHYKMRGTLTVLEPEQYRAWLREAAAASARAFDPEDAQAHWGWAWKEP